MSKLLLSLLVIIICITAAESMFNSVQKCLKIFISAFKELFLKNENEQSKVPHLPSLRILSRTER